MTHAARPGEVVWYVTGRFYETPPDAAGKNKLFDAGYFLHLAGIAEATSESSAHFTFTAEPFTSPAISNGGLNIGIDRRGLFSIHYLEHGGGNFDDPKSFAAGPCIATFERVSMVPTVTAGTILMNVFSAQLVSSMPFDFRGARYDLRDTIGYGITQWGTAAPQASLQPPSPYIAVVPFVGSALRIG